MDNMLEEYQEQQRKQASKLKSFMDYAMGTLFFLIGVYFLIYNKWGVNFFNRQPSPIDYLIGGLFVLYGVWRVYRGYKKKYFR